jgi:hypothetical protein
MADVQSSKGGWWRIYELGSTSSLGELCEVVTWRTQCSGRLCSASVPPTQKTVCSTQTNDSETGHLSIWWVTTSSGWAWPISIHSIRHWILNNIYPSSANQILSKLEYIYKLLSWLWVEDIDKMWSLWKSLLFFYLLWRSIQFDIHEIFNVFNRFYFSMGFLYYLYKI